MGSEGYKTLGCYLTACTPHLYQTCFYQSSSVPDLESTKGLGTIEKGKIMRDCPCERVAREVELFHTVCDNFWRMVNMSYELGTDEIGTDEVVKT